VFGKQNTLHNLLVLQTSENIRLKQFEKQYSCIQLRDNFMQRGLEKLIFPGFMGTNITYLKIGKLPVKNDWKI
jgi:hypothetical protein